MPETPEEAALAAASIMPGVAAADLARVMEAGSVQTFSRGRVLWRADTTSQGLYFVVRGEIRVVRARRGRQHLVHTSGPGSTMGEAALFGRRRYPATAIVSKDATCFVVPSEAATRLLSECPSFSRFLLERAAQRVEKLVKRLEAQTLGAVRSRVAASLLGIISEAGSSTVELPTPQAEWAEDLGTVREVLSRELKALCDQGLVRRVDRGRLRVLDEDGLERVALGDDPRAC